ncbi:MAG: hypothetical protein K6C34_03790 [Alphaproteobacteria bacterium]|nr:hypothetical protein [Alphaproteobacteria bacterium]
MVGKCQFKAFIGRLSISDQYVDRDNELPHQTRVDNSKLITYVTDKDGVKRQISCVPHKTEQPKVHVYVRSGGYEPREPWQGVALNIKPSGSRPLHKNEILQIRMAEHFNLPHVLRGEYRLNKRNIRNVRNTERVLRKYHIDIFRLMQILHDCLAKYMSPNK